MKLKQLMDYKSIDILLMEENKRRVYIEKQMTKLGSQSGGGVEDKEQKHTERKIVLPCGEELVFDCSYADSKKMYRAMLVMISDGLLESLKEKDPQYHDKLWNQIQKKKGDAEIDFHYIEKKLPLVGVINSVLGIYKSRNPVNLESFMESFQTEEGAKNFDLIMKKGDNEDFALVGDAAKSVMPFFGVMAVEALKPALKEMYAEMRETLNLS